MNTDLLEQGEQEVTRKQLSALARKVKQLREAAGLSQQALAVRAGLSVSVVSRLEQGAHEDPRLSTIRAIAEALGVGVDDLLVEDKPARGKKKGKAD